MLEALLDSWNRNNSITTNLLQAIPAQAWHARALPDSPTIAEMFSHLHYVRLVLVSENAPEIEVALPEEEWTEADRKRLAQQFAESAARVRDAFVSRVKTERNFDVHYDHPTLMLEHLIWHEGYHHGQIKLALKAAGHTLSDEQAGPLTWDIWMDKK